MQLSDIRSKPNSPAWYDNYDRIFGKKKDPEIETCIICEKPGEPENPIIIGRMHRRCHDAVATNMVRVK